MFLLDHLQFKLAQAILDGVAVFYGFLCAGHFRCSCSLWVVAGEGERFVRANWPWKG